MNGVVLAPGTLRLLSAHPNPNGAAESQLYLFTGDATAAPIQTVELGPGVALPQSPGVVGPPEFFLRIYHFNDLHGHLMRFPPGGEESVFSRLAWQLRSARQKFQADPHTAVLLLTAGDDCSGSILDEMLADDSQGSPAHPGYHLYSKIGVDAAGLGNHDLDRGLPFLAQVVRHEARFPILVANLRGCQELSGVCHPAALLVVKGIRIGLIGLVTRAETRLDPAGCQIVDPIPVAHNLVSAIRPLCDVLIILSHLGYSLEEGSVPMMDAGDVELAQSLPDSRVDLIVGGHSHSALNPQGLNIENIVNGIPIVQAGAQGKYLGQVDITIQEKTVAVTDAGLIPTTSLPVDRDFEAREMQPLIRRARDLRGQCLGRVENIPELSTETVQHDFAKRELALANFVTDALVDRLARRGQPVDFAMIDSSCLLHGLPVGATLTLGDWFEIMPYADTLRIFQITGRQLKDLLDDNALRTDRPGEPHTERGFLQFSRQLRYMINLGKVRSEARSEEITVHEIPLDEYEEHIFVIAATSFTRELAAAWETGWSRPQGRPFLDLHEFPFTETDIFLRQELVAYLQEHWGVTRAGGAQCDGRLQVEIGSGNPMTTPTVHEFIDEVSGQNHAMAGAVIALSAAQAAALGQACLQISLNLLGSSDEVMVARIETLAEIKNQLFQWYNRDANAIAEFVALREAGQELAGQHLLCKAPAQVGHLSAKAAGILQDARPIVNERVKDDLEMSINLLACTARAAVLLLDSNLRIWPEKALLVEFEPVLADLETAIDKIQPKKRIRT